MAFDFAFFSFVFEVVGVLDDAVAVFACFSVNFFAFSAFLRSFSTTRQVRYHSSIVLLIINKQLVAR